MGIVEETEKRLKEKFNTDEITKDNLDLKCSECGKILGVHVNAVCPIEPADSNSALSDGLDCHPPIEIVQLDKYRAGGKGLHKDYDRVRVVLDLKLPEHLKLYYKLKGMAD